MMTRKQISWYNAMSAISSAGAWYIMHGPEIEPMPFIEDMEWLTPENFATWTNGLSKAGLSMWKEAQAYQCGWNRWWEDTWKEK